MLLSTELNLVSSAIDLLLGGTGTTDAAPQRERLTDIDWALARHFFDRLVAQLSIVWQDVTDVELGIAGLDMHLETAQTAPVSEPTLSLTIEARMERDSSTLALLIPFSAIARVRAPVLVAATTAPPTTPIRPPRSARPSARSR